MLFDRLHITDPVEVGQIWSRVMERVYNLGGRPSNLAVR